METSRLKLIVIKNVMYPHMSHGDQADKCPIKWGKLVFPVEFAPDQILRQMVGVDKDLSCNSRLCWLQCKLDCPAKDNILETFKIFFDGK